MTISVPKKSTIVRSSVPPLVRTLDVVAPATGAALVEHLWFRLRRRPPLLDPTGTPFELLHRGRAVRGQTWGEGPAVYLVHGWEGNSDQMVALARPLVAAGFRVVAFDGPGHGRSDGGAHGPASTDAVELGQALDTVVAHFGPAHAVVAHSLGVIATLVAVRDGWVIAERLVLVAPTQGVPHWMGEFRRQLGYGDRTERHLRRRLVARTGYDPDELDITALAVGARGTEVVVVQDSADRQIEHSSAGYLAATVPGARLVQTHGLGHNRVLADPSVVGTVTAFVATGELLEPHRVA